MGWITPLLHIISPPPTRRELLLNSRGWKIKSHETHGKILDHVQLTLMMQEMVCFVALRQILLKLEGYKYGVRNGSKLTVAFERYYCSVRTLKNSART